MLEKLLQLNNFDNSVKKFTENVRRGKSTAVFGVTESFKHILAASVSSPVLYCARDGVSAEAALRAFRELGKHTVYIPPEDELLLSAKAFSRESVYARIAAADKLKTADIIVLPIETLMQPFPRSVRKLVLKTGEEIDPLLVVKELVAMGYRRADEADAKGVFSVRGDVLDVFPIDSETPYRADFFGDTVDSIKKVDAETRKNLGFQTELEILAAQEFCFSEQTISGFEKIIREELRAAPKGAFSRLKIVADDLITAVTAGDGSAFSTMSPLADNFGSIFDALPENCVMIIDEPKRAEGTAILYEREFTERFAALYQSGEVFSFAEKNFFGLGFIKDEFAHANVHAVQSLATSISFFNPQDIINPAVSAVSDYHRDFSEIYRDTDNWLKGGYKVLLFTGDEKRAEKLCLDLSDNNVPCALGANFPLAGAVSTPETFGKGFVFHEEKLAVIGTSDLYAKSREKAQRPRSKKQTFFTAPAAGDFCVHETHGVGRVLGNKKITTSEGTKDYISVEYSGGDVLYVPVEQMDILTRYLGAEKSPRLSKIGGADFEKIKAAVKESIKKMSFDLKKLYSERNALAGFPFSSDEELEKAFDEAFPFEETPDQVAADEDIKKDMESERVMDRLVCGDVGFGKTEVAFRAVFRAVENGKQAALLAPTTILTEQHYNTAVKRFAGFGVKTACLNRFKSDKEVAEILRKLKNGEIDFIIGTHRLLSKDVGFKDLGLLVLDEEQRFGVEHKEKIKLLKKNVDAITLTATPIPRTLHISLSGIRPISVINTPPKKRLPVQTYVTEETDALIKDAITREINRGGQAFILYNRVESIFRFSERVRALMPDLKFTVCHGRMDEKTMEKNVLSFYEGETDVLISTTIIENGIDLPKANTLIVIDADRLGLSTLYQLKGRVGRSDRLAYAYFTFKRDKILSDAAADRLTAITEFTEMGSGIKIAMRDLEIRGAGNILGAEQHGHMDKIGYELYSKLLREELAGKEERVPELDVRLSAFIPDSYIESKSARMDVYKEIAELTSEKEERELVSALSDNYGELPAETENLILISAAKRLAMGVGTELLTVTKTETSLEFDNYKAFANEGLQRALDEFSKQTAVVMTGQPKIVFKRDKRDNYEMLLLVRDFLAYAAATSAENKKNAE